MRRLAELSRPVLKVFVMESVKRTWMSEGIARAVMTVFAVACLRLSESARD